MSPRIALVSPRPPQPDGTGDQRRAQDLVESLGPIADLDVVSWIPPGQALPLPRSPRALLRLLKLLPGRPLQVAITQASCPAEVNEVVEKADLAVFVTDRAPYGTTLPPNSVIDFIDDLGAVVGRRAAESAGLCRLFWRLESWRLRSYDRKLVASAAVAVAHAAPDAAGLGPGVRAIGLPFRLEPAAPAGDKILFLGNLYYHPNGEAACWICRELVPELDARGIPPQRVLLCGRRPGRALSHLARRAGVDFRPDVPNTSTVMAEAALVLCPTTLGTGAITKVIDAVGALRPTVITPLANEGLGLVDGESAMVRARDAGLFADAVQALLASEDLRVSIADAAYERMRDFQPDAVREAWRDVVNDVLRSASPKPPETQARVEGLYPRAVGAGKAAAGYLARIVDRHPVGAKVVRSIPLPAKRLVVHRLSTTGMPPSTRARVGGVLFDLDLRDLLQRSIYFNAYERRDLRVALKLTPAGGVCLDVGANVGYYALNLARKVGPAGVVHSFEPDPANYERLAGNCVLNGLDGRVRTSRIALSSRAGEAVLHTQPGRSGDGTLAGFGDGWTAHETVRTETLDAYLTCNRIRRVDLAKIDVEGHEFEVLEGAAGALEHGVIRSLLIEYNGSRLAELGHTLDDFLGVLRGHGYTPVLLNLVLLRLLERGIVDPRLVSVNFLFQPASSR